MFELQLLHANDFEGGSRTAFNRADEWVAVADQLERQFLASMDEDANAGSLTLSSGDAVLAGPIFDAGGAGSDELNATLQEVHEELLGLESGTLAGFESDSGRPDITLLHILGMDAVTVGNHEFDAGPGAFADFVAPDSGAESLGEAEWLGTFFPYLSTNLDFSGDEDLGGLVVDESDGFRGSASFTPGSLDTEDGVQAAINDDKLASATVVDVNGEQVGVVGATTQGFDQGLISDIGGVTVDGDPGGNDIELLAQQIQEDVDRLTAQGIDKIVVQTHLQAFNLEQQLAPLLEDVDVLIAGGSNAISANDFDRQAGQPNSTTDLNPGDEADATYPQIIDGADGSPTALVSTDGNWEYVGNLVVQFDENGVIVPDSIDPTESGPYAATQDTIDELYDTPDDAFAEGSRGAQAREVVDATTQIVREQDGNIAGVTDVVLQGERAEVRSEETNLGNLTADANLWYAQQFDEDVQVSFKNGGGIRASIADIVNNPDGTTSLVPPRADPEIGKPEGGVSQISAGSALAFNNALTLLTLTQEQLVDLIESGTAGPGQITGGFGQLSGVRYSYDPTREDGERLQELALVEGDTAASDQASITTQLVEDGQFVGDADATVRIVTLNFLADVGSDVLTSVAESEASNRVDLNTLDQPDGLPNNFTFSEAGREQDAFVEYMNQFFPDQENAFDQPDTDELADDRIENELFDTVAEIFAGTFGRAPSVEEIMAQFETLETGGTLDDVAANLASQEGAPGFLANPSTDAAEIGAFVDTVFQNAFDRAADDDGRAFWIDDIQARVEGESDDDLDTIVIDIISGAQNTDFGNDIGAIANRGEVGQLYAEAVLETDVGFDADAAGDVMEGLGAGSDSLQDALSEIQSLFGTVPEAFDIAA